jgi:hypothetical protein
MIDFIPRDPVAALPVLNLPTYNQATTPASYNKKRGGPNNRSAS